MIAQDPNMRMVACNESVNKTARRPPAIVYNPVRVTVEIAPIQNAFSGDPNVSGNNVSKTKAPA